MTTLKTIIDYLDSLAPRELSCPGDSDGIDVCFDYNMPAEKILICLDVTMDAAKAARDGGYSLVVSHHSMMYNAVEKFDCKIQSAEKALYLARNNIAAVSMHTRLDAAPGGVNDSLLEAIGVDPACAVGFGPADCDKIGRVFELEKPHSVEGFAVHIKNKLDEHYAANNAPFVKSRVDFVDNGRAVRRVAMVGGGGQSFFADAIKENIDTFFTGEIKYPTLVELMDTRAENGEKVNIIIAGHYETEAVVLEFLRRKIKTAFPEIEVKSYYSERIKVVGV